ncbi:type II secretion system pilot lipoprotein GspS-beta, partial [Escherichia coli]|uniref:type II secretion system pilot lipoprotein GspS-beta n=1 Tax=Escherichia coli TaxID=562 RepID=UPI0022AF0ACE
LLIPDLFQLTHCVSFFFFKSSAAADVYKRQGYTLVLAQSSGTTVKMTIISEAGAQTTQTPDAFLTSYQRQMCADPTVKLMITEGINYSITINDTRTGNQYQRKLDRTTCGIVKA